MKQPNRDVLVQFALNRLKSDFCKWYKDKKLADPEQAVYELQDLTTGMVGTAGSQCLSTKAAETGTLVGWCHHMVQKHLAQLGNQGKSLLHVGQALVGARDLMCSRDRILSPADQQLLVDFARRAFVLREAAGIKWAPKWHLFLHLCHRARYAGNPYFYSTFVDEGYNVRLAKMASSCHRMTWYDRVLSGFRLVYSRARRRRV